MTSSSTKTAWFYNYASFKINFVTKKIGTGLNPVPIFYDLIQMVVQIIQGLCRFIIGDEGVDVAPVDGA